VEITREDRVRMERAHVLAWPALRSAAVDGWLWRSSGGGSQRANSVSTIDFTGNDVAAAIADVEARYRAVGAVARFQTFDETTPVGLGEMLRRRGYIEGEATITMFKRPEPDGEVVAVETRVRAWPEWLAVYLGEITESRREVNSRILDLVPESSAFFGYQRDGAMIATALCVVGFGCAVIECVTTRADARRQGAARAVLGALEAWAARQGVDWVGLQVTAQNRPAIRLYERLGFLAGATNRFWVQQAMTV
jgi:ribosomal protein S18 acetylase RimI-like enzyme